MALVRGSMIYTPTIANGATTSSAVRAEHSALYQLILPAAFTGVALTFTTCDTETGTYQALYDNTGAAVSLTVAQGRNYDLPSALASSKFFKIVSGSAEGAARTLKIVAKG